MASGLLRQASRDRKKNEILEAATACFAEKGFHATTMQDIARRMGMSVGNLYNYFSGKANIVAELSKNSLDQMVARVEKIGTISDIGEEQCLAEIYSFVRSRIELPKIRVSMEIMCEAMGNEEVAVIVRDCDEMWRKAFVSFYEMEGIPAHVAAVNIEIELAMIAGLASRIISNPDLDPDEMAMEVARRIRHNMIASKEAGRTALQK